MSKSGSHPFLLVVQLVFIVRMADGDMGHRADALSCYMKQKHRMIWERRHGPVGSGKEDVMR